VDGRRVEARPLRWLALYKPAGYVTTRKDERGRPTVYALLPPGCEDLFHVGRLDRLTEGLLIVTNDGELAHRLLHPRHGIARRYRALVEGLAGAVEARRLERGGALTEVQLTLREGRKREVRRMLETVGLPVKRLVRLEFGPIALGRLKPGEWRDLTAREVRALRAAVGLGDSDGDT
jgi:23S rRNA pseudouridine2605 synthase